MSLDLSNFFYFLKKSRPVNPPMLSIADLGTAIIFQINQKWQHLARVEVYYLTVHSKLVMNQIFPFLGGKNTLIGTVAELKYSSFSLNIWLQFDCALLV